MEMIIRNLSIDGDKNKLLVQFAGDNAGKLYEFSRNDAAHEAANFLEVINDLQDEGTLGDYEIFSDDSGNYFVRNKKDFTCTEFEFSDDDSATAAAMVDWYFDRVKELSAE